ncbi:MAG TPA: IS1595 family transposase, partial [Pyrinomonadaceae bacterium]|nr:IS1595 family transposase [Pyrinomonadaceae bacterium]
MQQLNRYYRRSKISERKTRRIIKYFSLDLTA